MCYEYQKHKMYGVNGDIRLIKDFRVAKAAARQSGNFSLEKAQKTAVFIAKCAAGGGMEINMKSAIGMFAFSRNPASVAGFFLRL